MSGPFDGWAVGWMGTILQLRGDSWHVITSPITAPLRSVSVPPDDVNDAWIASWAFEEALRWNGSHWSPFQKPFGSLESVKMLHSTSGWAVGSTGTIHFWGGSHWMNSTNPTNNSLYSVDVVTHSTEQTSTIQSWAVGANGTILHNYTMGWVFDPSPTTQLLRSVDIVSLQDGGYAVGNAGTILHLESSQWRIENSSTTQNLHGVSMWGPKTGWAVGAGGVILLRPLGPRMASRFHAVRPGSFITIQGINFPANASATITVNGRLLTNALTVDSAGSFTFVLDTHLANPGRYRVTASVNPSDSTEFVLDDSADLIPNDGAGPVLVVPSDIAIDEDVYVPLVVQ